MRTPPIDISDETHQTLQQESDKLSYEKLSHYLRHVLESKARELQLAERASTETAA